jgi:hypothetical protein
MRWSFISIQQVLSACMFAAPLFIFAARRGKRAVIAAAVICAVVVGGAVGIEFLIDRSDVNNLLLYVFYVLLLAVPAVFGLIWKKGRPAA